MAGEDVTLKLGGESDALVAAVKQGGDAFAAFVQKSSTNAEKLGQKLREVGGADIIADANQYAKSVEQIGGATRLTTAEKAKLNASLTEALEKYKALGHDAPDALKKLHTETTVAEQSTSLLDSTMGQLVASFTVANLIDRGIGLLSDWGREAIDTASRTVDLSNKTGLATETIQRMAAAAEQTGVPLETLAQAAYQLGIRVENGSKKAQAAAEDLGLSWRDLVAASPDDKFRMVMAALEGMEDPTRRNAAAQALFGGSAKAAAQAAADGYSTAAAAARVSSDGQVRAINDAADAWAKFVRDVKTGFASWAGTQVQAAANWSELRKQVSLLTAEESNHYQLLLRTGGVAETYLLELMNKRLAATKAQTEEHKKAKPVEEAYSEQLKAVAAEVAGLTAEQRKEIAAGLAVGKTTDDISDKYGISGAAVEALKKQIDQKAQADDQAAQAAKQHGEEEKKRQDALFGRDLIARANQYVHDLGAVENVTRLSKEQTEKLNTAVLDGLRAYQRLGEGAPEALRRVGVATTLALAGFEKDINALKFDTDKPVFDPTVIFGFEKDKKYELKFDDIFTIDKNPPKAPLENWANVMTGWAKQLPTQIANAFTGGGGWEGALQASASTIGASAMGHLFGKAGKDGFGLAKGMEGVMGSVVESMGPVIGALAGPAIELLVKAFKKPEHLEILKDVGRQWGVTISEGLAKQIEADAAKLFHKDRSAAELFNLDAIIKESGGLTSANYDKFMGKLHDVFSLMEQGKFTAAQAAQVIDKNWGDFVRAGTDGNGRISASLKEIIALNERMGVQSKEIAAWQQQQGMDAVAGVVALVAGTKDAAAGYADLRQAVEDAMRAAAAGTGTADDVTAAIERQRAAAAGARGELEDLGIQAVASFAAAVAAGKTQGEALAAISPALTALKQQYDDLNISTDDTALKNLFLQNTILQGNPQLLGAIGGLNQEMVALDNLNLMNAESFAAMQRTGDQLYTRLQAAVEKTGGSTRDALLPMQDYLHQAEAQAKLLGIPLSENTLQMIEQSKQLGIWKATGPSAAEQNTSAMKDLVGAVRELINTLMNIPAPTVGVHWAPDPFPQPPDSVTVDGGDGGDVGHAAGGVFTRPHRAWIAEGGRAEIVGDVPFMTRALTGAFQQIAQMEASLGLGAGLPLSVGGGSTSNVSMSVMVDARGARFNDRDDVQELARQVRDELVNEMTLQIPVGVPA